MNPEPAEAVREAAPPADCDAALRRVPLSAAGRSARLRFLALLAPGAIYLASLWVLVPLPFPYATALLLLLSPLVFQVSRRYALATLQRLGLEFSLLLFMALLAVLSLANAEEPFRAFRVLFPCLAPFCLFAYFMVLGYHSREALLGCSRVLVAAGFLLSVLPFFASYALPPLADVVWETYRLRGFFQISIQHGIALAVLVPLLSVELALRRGWLGRLVLAALMLALLYTLFRAGSKTSLGLGLAWGMLAYLVVKFRRQSFLRTGLTLLGVALLGGFLALYGLDLAERLEPETGAKLRDIFERGATTYQSVQVRRNLWQLAIEDGKAHWLVGAGAGKVLLGYPHAHNLVLDYFKNIGLFGAAAVVLLCLAILFRAGRKAFATLLRGGDDADMRILACYFAAAVYVLANQMSDSFGPSTIGFLWSVYLIGVIADGGAPRGRPRSRRRAGR